MDKISFNIDLFLEYLKTTKSYSEKTVYNYWLWLKRFNDYISFLEGKKNIQEIEAMDITKFRSFLHSEWLSKRTINYHIIAIRSFFKYLQKNDIQTLAIEKLELAKSDPRTIVFLTKDEVSKILKVPIEFEKNELKRYRDLLILHILYGSWLRVSELISLKKSHFCVDTNQINIVWKWNKQRAVFLTQNAIKYMNKYLSIREDESEFLIISLSRNSFARQISRAWIENIVRDYASLALIDKKVTPHTLRHSFATSLLMKWADIRSVQELLWHSSITTTQIYTHISDSHLQKVHSLIDN